MSTGNMCSNCETLRQRVKELEEFNLIHKDEKKLLREELAALKQSHGDPVVLAWANLEGTRFVGNNEKFKCKECVLPLYTSAPTIPEGWQIVPIEPTNSMRIAGNVRAEMWQGKDVGVAVWYDMLAAAPKPEDVK